MKKVLVWISGGVDSAVAAHLLKQEGYQVAGGFMINYQSGDATCTTNEDKKEAMRVAQFLELDDMHFFDFRKAYWNTVVEYLFEGYRKGITPNPDILCNSEIKFKLFLDKALELGYDYIATGHYARISQDDNDVYHLCKGLDPNKDQSYFLAGLNQKQLSHALFPLGEIQKPQVREIAKEAKLPNASRPDSQGICFIGKVSLEDFLSQRLPKQTGPILDMDGKKIWEHNGAWFYTVGQRKGLGLGGMPQRYFVISKDIDTNTITVGPWDQMELYSNTLLTKDWNWIANRYELPLRCEAKIRYLEPCKPVTLKHGEKEGSIEFVFDQQERGVAPGQIATAYIGDELIGSGVIEK